MKKAFKVCGKVLLCIVIIFALFTAGLTVYHRVMLGKEAGLRAPLGQMVEVEGKNMCVYTEGSGSRTLVFLSGCATPSPVLDFRSLYSLLSDDYRIAVVERFGYGASDMADGERTADIMLEEDRAALEKAGLTAPYVLCAHSLAGLEAVSWSQLYPDEVEAVVGLDMSLPNAYDNTDTDIPAPAQMLIRFAAETGYLRLPFIYGQQDALKYGTLTEDEKEQYKAVFFAIGYNKTVMQESADLKKSIEQIKLREKPDTPMLLFVSDDPDPAWHEAQHGYIEGNPQSRYVELSCGHYVHDAEYKKINEEMREFLDGLAS